MKYVGVRKGRKRDLKEKLWWNDEIKEAWKRKKATNRRRQCRNSVKRDSWEEW